MAFNADVLTFVFEKSGGRCTYCEKQLSWANYGVRGTRGGWEVDHSRARSNGGTDHGNNLVAACWSCNLDKSNDSRRSFKNRVEPLRESRRSKKCAQADNSALVLLFTALAVFLLPRILKALSGNKNEGVQAQSQVSGIIP